MEDWLCFGVTVAVQAEVALLFIGAGALGSLYYGAMFRVRTAPTLPLLAAMPAALGVSTAAPGSNLAKLLLFLLKAGSLTFGSGLVIVSFVEKGLVQQTGWLDARQFLVAVAIGMLSPRPVASKACLWTSAIGVWIIRSDEL